MPDAQPLRRAFSLFSRLLIATLPCLLPPFFADAFRFFRRVAATPCCHAAVIISLD